MGPTQEPDSQVGSLRYWSFSDRNEGERKGNETKRQKFLTGVPQPRGCSNILMSSCYRMQKIEKESRSFGKQGTSRSSSGRDDLTLASGTYAFRILKWLFWNADLGYPWR